MVDMPDVDILRLALCRSLSLGKDCILPLIPLLPQPQLLLLKFFLCKDALVQQLLRLAKSLDVDMIHAPKKRARHHKIFLVPLTTDR